MLTEEMPRRVIGDRAYDSDLLDDDLALHGIEMIAPHRSHRRSQNATQDARVLRRYRRRWTVERTMSWFQNFRRLCVRWKKSTLVFQGYFLLGCAILLLKEVVGKPLDNSLRCRLVCQAVPRKVTLCTDERA